MDTRDIGWTFSQDDEYDQGVPPVSGRLQDLLQVQDSTQWWGRGIVDHPDGSATMYELNQDNTEATELRKLTTAEYNELKSLMPEV